MTLDPRVPNPNDQFGGFNPDNLPDWLKAGAGAVGDKLAGGMGLLGNAPVLGGALQAAVVPARYAAGAAALGADAFLNTGLSGAIDRSHPDTPFWARPMAAQETLFNEGFQNIAEDPNAPAWSRVMAQVPRGAELMGELRAPLPGLGAVKPLLKGERLAGAARGVIGHAPWSAAEGAFREAGVPMSAGYKAGVAARQLGGDLVPGLRELQTAKSLVEAAGRAVRPRTTVHALGPEGPTVADAMPEDTRNQTLNNMTVTAAKVRDLPDEARLQTVRELEALQKQMYGGNAVADDTVGAMWQKNGVSYRNIIEALENARDAADRMQNGVPGLSVETDRYGGVNVTFRDEHGDGVGTANLSQGTDHGGYSGSEPIVGQVPDAETGSPLKVRGWRVDGMYLDDTHPAKATATRELFGKLNEMRAFTGSTLSYYSAKLLHRMSVENRLLTGGEIPDKVMQEIDPVTEKPFYSEADVRRMKSGRGALAVGRDRTSVAVGMAPYAPGTNTSTLLRSHQQTAADVAKRNGVELKQTKFVGDNAFYGANGLEFTFTGNIAKAEQAAAELGHLYDSPAKAYHYGRSEKTGVPFGEVTFHGSGIVQELTDSVWQDISQWGHNTSIDYSPSGQGGAMVIRSEGIEPKEWALFISRLNDRLTGESQSETTIGTTRVGRVVEFGRDAQVATLASRVGPDAARSGKAGGTGASDALAPRGSARDQSGVTPRPTSPVARSTRDTLDPSAPGSVVEPHNGVIQRSDPYQHTSSYDSTAYDDAQEARDYEYSQGNSEYDDLSSSYDNPRDALAPGSRAADIYAIDHRNGGSQYYVFDSMHATGGISTQNGVEVAHVIRPNGDGTRTDMTVPLTEITTINDAYGDPLFDSGSGHAASQQPYSTAGTTPNAHPTLEAAINDELAMRVLDEYGRWHDLPNDLHGISPGGRSLRVGSGPAIPRTSVLEVVDDSGQTLWSRNGVAGNDAPRNASGHLIDRVQQVPPQRLAAARHEVQVAVDEAQATDVLVTRSGRRVPIGDTPFVSRDEIRTGEGTVPLVDVVSIESTDGSVHWDSAVPDSVFGGLIRFVTGEGGAKQVGAAVGVNQTRAVGSALRRLFSRGRDGVPNEQVPGGPIPDNVAEVVPAATRGSRTVGDNSEPFVTGGPTPDPESFSVPPNDQVSPGSRVEVGPPGPARHGRGIENTGVTDPMTPEVADLQHSMTTPVRPHVSTSVGELLEQAATQQGRRIQTINRTLVETGNITGPDADLLLNGLKRGVQDGTVTELQLQKVQKALQPVIDAQRFYNDMKDINSQIAAQAHDILDIATAERGKAVRTALGLQKKIADVETAGINRDIATQRQLDSIAEQHAMRVDKVMETSKKTVEALASGNVDSILRTIDEMETAIGEVKHAGTTSARRTISRADAEALAKDGYLSTPDRDLQEQLGFNTGMHAPSVARIIIDGIRDNRAEYEAANRKAPGDESIHHAETAQSAAPYVGVEADTLIAEARARGLTEPGDLTAFMVGIRLGVITQVKKLQALARAGAGDPELLAAHSEFQRFLVAVGGAQSEVGRALESQKITMTKRLESAFGERGAIGQMRTRIVDADALREKAAIEVAKIKDRYDGLLARATDRASKALTASEKTAADGVKRELDKAQVALDLRTKTLATLREAESNAIVRARDAIDNYRSAAMESMLADSDSIDSLKAILKLEDQDIGIIANTVRNIKKVSRGDAFIAYVSNNAYSSWNAQMGNAFSPFLRMGHLVMETRLAETAGKAYTKATGKEAPIAPGETRALVRGIGRALRQSGSGETLGEKVGTWLGRDEAVDFAGAHWAPPRALEVMMDVMLNGHANDAASRMQDLEHPNIITGKKAAVLQFWLRTNGAFDAFGKHLFNIAEQEALYTKYARRAILEEGGTVTPEALEYRTSQLLLNPSKAIAEEAGKIATQTAYQGKAGKWAEKAFEAVNHRFDLGEYIGPTPLAKAVILASRFTWAATMYSIETTPIGLLKAANRLREAKGLATAGDAFGAEMMARSAARMGARGAVGSAATMWAMQLYAAGTLIGKDPDGMGHDDTIKVGDTYIPLKQLWPISAPFIYTAHTADKWHEADMKESDLTQHIVGMAEGWGEALGNQPVMRGIYQIMQALKYGGDSGTRLFANITGRVVPWSSFERDVARAIDGIDRDPRGDLLSLWKENLPFLSAHVDPKVNRWGESVLQNPQGIARLNPFGGVGQPQNPADIEIARLNNLMNPDTGKPYLDNIGPPTRNIGNVKLESNEHVEWQTTLGKARQGIGDLVLSDRYRTAEPKEQARLINQANNRATTQATRDFAAALLAKPDSASQVKGLRIGIGATSGVYDRVKLVEKAQKVLDANPDLVKQFDALKQPGDLTYAQYKQASQMLPLIEKQPEFSYFSGAPIGSQEQWDQYHDELKQYNQLIKDGRTAEANIWMNRHTVLRRYAALADRPGGKNAVITRMKAKYPILKYISLPNAPDDDEPVIEKNPLAKVAAVR